MMASTERRASFDRRRRGRPRDENVRQRILQAAVKLLAEVGYGETTIGMIAKLARVSKATVYRWWPNKVSVLIEAFREAASEEWPAHSTGILCEDLRTLLHRLVEVLTGWRGHMLTAFVVGAQNHPEMSAALRQLWFAPRISEIQEMLKRYSTDCTETIDVNVLVDLLHAPLYYRALTGCGPLSFDYSDAIAKAVLTVLLRSK